VDNRSIFSKEKRISQLPGCGSKHREKNEAPAGEDRGTDNQIHTWLNEISWEWLIIGGGQD
jgi:hypothetical protein